MWSFSSFICYPRNFARLSQGIPKALSLSELWYFGGHPGGFKEPFVGVGMEAEGHRKAYLGAKADEHW